MSKILIGYTRVSTEAQDLTAQRDALSPWALSLNEFMLTTDLPAPTRIVLAMISEFEADLVRMRTREGVKVVKAKGRLRGKHPILTTKQEKHLLELQTAGEHSKAELAELFSIGRSTVYRAIERGQLQNVNHNSP